MFMCQNVFGSSLGKTVHNRLCTLAGEHKCSLKFRVLDINDIFNGNLCNRPFCLVCNAVSIWQSESVAAFVYSTLAHLRQLCHTASRVDSSIAGGMVLLSIEGLYSSVASVESTNAPSESLCFIRACKGKRLSQWYRRECKVILRTG